MCDNCGAEDSSSACSASTFGNRVLLKHCGKCHSMNYCSRTCQLSHWSEVHRHECGTLATEWSQKLRSEIALRDRRELAAIEPTLDTSQQGRILVVQTMLGDRTNYELAARVMKVFIESSDVQWRVARAMGGMFAYDAQPAPEDQVENAKRANKSGIIAVLIQAMSTHASCKKVLICACSTLAALNFSYRQNIGATIKAGGVRVVIEAMTQHRTDAVAIECIIPVLSQILAEDDRMFAIGGGAGAVDVIVDALRMHMGAANGWGTSSRVTKVFTAMRFVTNLGRFESNVQTALSLGAMDIVLKIIGRTRISAEALCEGCVLVSELALRGIHEFIDAGGVECITRVATQHATLEPLQEYATHILSRVSKHSSEQRILMGTKKSGVTQVVLAAMREHRDNVHVQINAINTLNNLVLPEFEARSVAREAGAEFLVNVARCEHGNTTHTEGWSGVREACDHLLELLL